MSFNHNTHEAANRLRCQKMMNSTSQIMLHITFPPYCYYIFKCFWEIEKILSSCFFSLNHAHYLQTVMNRMLNQASKMLILCIEYVWGEGVGWCATDVWISVCVRDRLQKQVRWCKSAFYDRKEWMLVSTAEKMERERERDVLCKRWYTKLVFRFALCLMVL